MPKFPFKIKVEKFWQKIRGLQAAADVGGKARQAAPGVRAARAGEAKLVRRQAGPEGPRGPGKRISDVMIDVHERGCKFYG